MIARFAPLVVAALCGVIALYCLTAAGQQLQPQPSALSPDVSAREAGAFDASVIDGGGYFAPDAVADASVDKYESDVSVDKELPRSESEHLKPMIQPSISIPISEGVTLRVSPPANALGPISDPLDLQQLAEIPQARGLMRYRWNVLSANPTSFGIRMTAECATASSVMWGPDMQASVFERLVDYVKSDLGKSLSIESFLTDEVKERDRVRMQTFEVSGRVESLRTEGTMRVVEAVDATAAEAVGGVGRTFLTFLDEPRRVLVCIVSCVEPSSQALQACVDVISAVQLEGELAEEPSTSIVSRLYIGLKQQRLAIVGIVMGVLIGLSGVIVMLRGLVMRSAKNYR